MKTLRLLGLLSVAGAILLILNSGAFARTWTSADKSRTLEGELVGSDGTNVEIKLANGKTIKAPLTAFSREDRDFVAAAMNPETKPAPTVTETPAKPAKPEDMEPAKFEIWDIRACCKKAERMYEEAVAQVEGVKIEFGENQFGKKVIKVDAETRIAARAALDKIAEAGLYGETDSHEIKFRTPAGKAKGNMTATGVVFCCSDSVKALEGALKRSKGAVDGEPGVTDHTIKKSKDTFEIEGTAAASEILRHARKSGFNFTLENTGPAQ